MKFLQNIAKPKGTGPLRWRDVFAAVKSLQEQSTMTLENGVVRETENGLELTPGSRSQFRPLTVRADGDKMYCSPCFVFAGSAWDCPVMQGGALAQRLTDANAPYMTPLPTYVWLRVEVLANVAVSQYYHGGGESLTWRWSGVRLVAATVIGDEEAAHADVPGVIMQTTGPGANPDYSAVVSTSAMRYMPLATLVDGQYEITGQGNVLVLSSDPVSMGGGVFHYQPGLSHVGWRN